MVFDFVADGNGKPSQLIGHACSMPKPVGESGGGTRHVQAEVGAMATKGV